MLDNARGNGEITCMRYNEKLQKRILETESRLCVGIDPRPQFHENKDAIPSFISQLVEETAEYAAAYKPNMAYFEAMGLRGIEMLEEILQQMPEHIPVILDAKRSDIGETQKYYAISYFKNWGVDAVTLNPFMGYDSIEPFLDWEGKGIYLLAVTSNAGSADFQRQMVRDRYVFELVQDLAQRAQKEKKATDVGLVVGLTNADEVLSRIGDFPLLIPGLGAQGGDLDAMAGSERTAPDTINVSRGISYAEPEKSYAQKAKFWAEKIAQSYPPV